MSVTFAAAYDATRYVSIGFAVTCYMFGPEHDFQGPVFALASDAETAHRLSHGDDPDCDGGVARMVYASNGPETNFANGNAARILSWLGYSLDGLMGSDDAEAFRARVIRARDIAWTQDEDGHDWDRVTSLLPVADYCLATGQRVAWS